MMQYIFSQVCFHMFSKRVPQEAASGSSEPAKRPLAEKEPEAMVRPAKKQRGPLIPKPEPLPPACEKGVGNDEAESSNILKDQAQMRKKVRDLKKAEEAEKEAKKKAKEAEKAAKAAKADERKAQKLEKEKVKEDVKNAKKEAKEAKTKNDESQEVVEGDGAKAKRKGVSWTKL